MAKKLLFFGIFALVSWLPVHGQCSCNGTFYYYDGGGDGFPANWQSTNVERAYLDHIDSGCNQGISGNVIYSCTPPSGSYTTNSREDCNDSDSSVWRTNIWYIDADGDGAYGTQQSGCRAPPSNSSPNRNDCDDSDSSVQSLRTFYEDNDNEVMFKSLCFNTKYYFSIVKLRLAQAYQRNKKCTYAP